MVAYGIGIITISSAIVGTSQLILQFIYISPYSPLFLAFIFVIYFFRPIFWLPQGYLTTFIGFNYNFYFAVLIAAVGGLLSSLVPYFAARYLNTSSGLLGITSTKCKSYFDTTGDLSGLLAARLSPIPTDVVSYSAGFANISFQYYTIGTVVGEIPWIVALVVIGGSLKEWSPDQANVPNQFFIGITVLALVVVASRFVYYAFLKRN